MADGTNSLSPLRDVSHQFLLEDSSLLAAHFDAEASANLAEITRGQRRCASLPLREYFERYANRDEAIAQAYESTAYSMAKIASFLGVSHQTVARAMHRMEEKRSR